MTAPGLEDVERREARRAYVIVSHRSILGARGSVRKTHLVQQGTLEPEAHLAAVGVSAAQGVE